jgi:tRNA nucleotidyltransferase/poly(A) polymerase
MLRFATKNQYIIDDKSLSIIVNNKKIFQNELVNPRLKEIIHKEMNLIFCSPNPSFAIYSLYKLDLLEYVLQIKSGYKNIHKNFFSEKDILNCVNIFIIGKKIFDKYQSSFEGENFDDKYKCTLYSILLTIHMRNFMNNSTNILAKMILANTLKLESKENMRILTFFDDFNNFFVKTEYNKLNVGILLRKILVRNISTMIFISVANEYVMNINSNEILDKIDDDILGKIFQKYFEFYVYMKKEKMEKVDEIKPIFDAKRIKNEFHGIPKHYIGELLDTLVNKQIEKDYNLSEEDAINALKNKIEELNIKYKKKGSK